MFQMYQSVMRKGEPLLQALLDKRVKSGKEDPSRLHERTGRPQMPRPAGRLAWIHAASVGEAQSALILVHRLLDAAPDLHILVTTGTVTSAKMMKVNLPERAFHQFFPLDHPDWTAQFLDHWQPDCVLWMESELWPSMLAHIRQREIPAALINARLSKTSFARWRLMSKFAADLLKTFSVILCQTENDARRFRNLGAQNVHITDNLKYSAKALPCDETDLKNLLAEMRGRPCWVYASTHAGEETLACETHEILKAGLPDILTIIVPRHPDRRDEIKEELAPSQLKLTFRGPDKTPPAPDTDIYIADTLGELGLFYRACPVACIGRSFSRDGGGGHNPIEAAQLHCAIVHGPRIGNLQKIFDEMNQAGAALRASHPSDLANILQSLLGDPAELTARQETAFKFAQNKEQVVSRIMHYLEPMILSLQEPKRAQA